MHRPRILTLKLHEYAGHQIPFDFNPKVQGSAYVNSCRFILVVAPPHAGL